MSYIGLNQPQAVVDPNSIAPEAYAGRNLLINANFHVDAVVNQRGFAGGQPADGVYGYDRWKGSTGGVGLTQIVEAGNYKPSSTYTLSGTNVTTAQIVSPVSGNWQIDVPANADLIQLELGSVATEFEYVDPATQLAKCQRYFQVLDVYFTYPDVSGDTDRRRADAIFPTQMRDVPTIVASVTGGILDTTSLSVNGARFFCTADSNVHATLIGAGSTYDAEL